MYTQNLTINLRGQLYSLVKPGIMGIVNVTPDSFYAGSRTQAAADIEARVLQMLADGADMLDLGGYSTRPGAEPVSADEEYSRLARGLEAVRRVAPEAIVSIDTFRASVARKCVQEWGADIINDISAGQLDPDMAATCGELQVPVVLMHMRGTPQTMSGLCDYADVSAEAISELAFRIAAFREQGVADVIADPGFGFAKTPEQNYELMARLPEWQALECPLLVGISRKSMIYKLLGCTPAESLAGTTALNMAALQGGANILRVHDVREAADTRRIFLELQKFTPNQPGNKITYA